MKKKIKYIIIFSANVVILSRTWRCSAIWCFIQPENEPPINVYTTKKHHVGVALDGTTCGNNKICFASECIDKPDDF